MNRDQIFEQLTLQIDKNKIMMDAPMKEYTSFKAGGNAALLIEPQDKEQLAYAIKVLSENQADYFIMGNGTNLLIKDSGYSGAILKIGAGFASIHVDGTQVEAGAGALLSAVAKEALEASLTGFEFAAGIPGSIGGAAFMNAGAYDGEFSQIIESAEVISREDGRVITLNKEEMNLSYRHSIFQETGDIIVKVKLSLERGDKIKIKEKMKELSARRMEKQPLSFPSAGSFFKRPKGHFAGKLIHDAGLRGLTLGGAQVSPLHAGFIINTGDATAADIIDLMEVVKHTVFDSSGVMLEPEVRIIG
ncbi:UDP-N-acetylmuramate dehydrogenase [Sinanaerobacter chloroacetimidivorans]|uniref:UDP-N-acetylenolpyruvoylglucosamine reductase n=1 Tax=Sinanaerobacter chloroacetimidivorans TaxID=2818044 RepID=A0A8J7W6Q5_9FIRM|nr:UDP-N-acetylmuramate dehydrogenase [Sinanaerobacter chloroacetimidivorans]MBR0600343.1 UDP-N-acetylmuramate dehydrogenase [Sinanaerobacter chloroacetimidivorans]